jgi:sulfur carrier protein
MRLTVNGEYRTLPDRLNVAELLTELTSQTHGVAVAVNGAVVPRSAWSLTPLGDGDAVEVLTAVQGG